jgi:hypothetical protein
VVECHGADVHLLLDDIVGSSNLQAMMGYPVPLAFGVVCVLYFSREVFDAFGVDTP